jgi:SAM-dependent methyltransferase
MRTPGRKASWNQRVGKAGQYLRRSDLRGLMAEVGQFLAWKSVRRRNRRTFQAQSRTEAAFWDDFDVALARQMCWSSVVDFGYWAFQKRCDGRYPEMIDLILDVMAVPRDQPRRGLVLGCGDMVGEHTAFTHPKLPFAEVDAYDVSPKSIARARRLTDEKELKINYHLADINHVELPPDRYALIIISHAFHHFERIDHVAQQIDRALLPGGIFYTSDYIGPRRLQFTARQLFYAQTMLQLLPAPYRRGPDGKTRQRVQSAPPESLSPDEAICSDRILPALAQHLDVVWQCNYAGLLYPLLEGIAFNLDGERDHDLLELLFNVDYALCQTGEIEPNFTLTLATKRQAVPQAGDPARTTP